MRTDFEPFIGPAAGVTTSILWTATSLLFTAASRRVGPTVVNALRIVFALTLLAIVHRLRFDAWLPDLDARQVGYLALSGVIGLAIGDQALFMAFVHIGPRLATLIMTSAPLFAALFGWAALGETLSGMAWAGIILTIGGIAWVVFERPRMRPVALDPHRLRGCLFALLAAACQAGGLLLSKQGMGHGFLEEGERLAPQAATLVRMFFAALGMLPIVALHLVLRRRRDGSTASPRRVGSRSAGLLFISAGAIAGPFLGVWMSLVAADRAPVGVAQTLCSLTPVFILPVLMLFHKERISGRAALGAAAAVLGTALLFVPSG